LENILVNHASELEAQVAARTAELRETIGELEVFSYSVSHDLRSPLRAMQGFAQLVLKENADKLDPLSLRYLEGINHSAARMDALIADVLTYARLVRSDIKLQPINLDEFVPPDRLHLPAAAGARRRDRDSRPLADRIGQRGPT